MRQACLESLYLQISILTLDRFHRDAAVRALGPFEGVLLHSPLKHSGLGRYGNTLNPWDSVVAAARSWCAARSGAFLALGLSIRTDSVAFNGQRVYV